MKLLKIIDTTKKIDKNKYEKLYLQYVELAELTKINKVRLVLLETPMYETSQKYMGKDVENEMEMFVHRLQKVYSNVEYYNYSKDQRFEDHDFMDSSHLTELGAIKFSGIIRREVLERNAPSEKL